MAAPLIPIGVAVARAAAPHVARKVGQKAATQTATTTAKRNIGSTAARQAASRFARDAAEEGVYRGTDWGIDRLQRRGSGNAVENGGESVREVGQPLTGGEGQQTSVQGEPTAQGAPIGATGASSAFSVWDAFKAVQGNGVAQAASMTFAPLTAVHKGLTT